tara:strand:+ start:365 stop:1147 length:783 start_codon:yes stop_codon:yes gene_type:complete
MLENINTNMKVIIGISSITLLGILYSIIRNYFSPKKKIQVEGLGNNISTNNNSIGKLDISSLTGQLSELIDNNKLIHTDLKNYIKNTEDHLLWEKTHILESTYNITKNRKKIIINNLNTDYDSSNGVITIKKSDVVSKLGFPYSIYSIGLISSIIPKTSNSTPYVTLKLINSKLQQFLGNSDIFAIIPLNHISGSNINETITNYKEQNTVHYLIKYPITEHDLSFSIHQADDSLHDLSGLTYSFTIELIVDQGTQVSEII